MCFDDDDSQPDDGEPDTKSSWNFPKDHSHRHAAKDIRAKGITHNYNTKPNEKMHGVLKKIYLNQTNFKNIEGQVSI